MIDALISRVRSLLQGGQADEGAGANAASSGPEPVDLTEESARMAAWLPYSSYKPADKIFINKDSLGFVLELTPQTGANEDTAERLKGLYARLPTDSTFQVHLWASPNIRDTLRTYANLRQPDPDHQAREELKELEVTHADA